MKLDSAVASLLELDPSTTTVSSHGGAGMSSASTFKVTSTLSNGETKQFFMKTGSGKEAEVMFAGEHASLNAIHAAVPTFCPRSIGHGRLADDPEKSFLVTDFLDITGIGSRPESPSGMTLAQKLAKLHTSPAPTPPGFDQPQFGFPSPTCCGDTPQDNTYSSSWADFYATRRLRFILSRATAAQGPDDQLAALVDATCTTVVPRLLDAAHLNHGRGVVPVVVHGDLWAGNVAVGTLPGMAAPEDLVFDSSACYAHAEFDLGIMKMFSGFGRVFAQEYHSLVPKTEPVAEFEDRVELYQLYHALNHFALFGGGYRRNAVAIMKRLIAKYGGGGAGS
nr:ketosamine-3-kinase [Quercus suber]